MEDRRSKVFINPNFNKGSKLNGLIRQNTGMHVNPNFCPQARNSQVPMLKIYINPNFVRPNGISNRIPCINMPYSIERPTPLMDSSNTLSACVPTIAKQETNRCTTISNKVVSSQPVPVTSRYSIVRDNRTLQPQSIPKSMQAHTVKISKYKSINITDMKKKLDSLKPPVKSISFKHPSQIQDNSIMQAKETNKNIIQSKSPKTQLNRYRLVRVLKTTPTSNVVSRNCHLKRQTSINSKKVVNSRMRIKAVGVYKKNNIPCPLYRKYGKCLRNLYGKCEFLHDKKHVSICRKFLNGVCHNDKCLLSHELSDKKMPTCYFYLKGMCTKERCPYLHVKLNEKAKICTDFLKGYCEKGDKCLNRHITKSLNVVIKRQHGLRKQYPQKSTKYIVQKSRNKFSINTARKNKIPINEGHSNQEKNDSSSRYYKESIQEASCSGLIKPSRCKLGTLPSFIQL